MGTSLIAYDPSSAHDLAPGSVSDRESVTALVTRALHDDDDDGVDALHCLIALAAAGDRRAERAYEAILAVDVEHAKANGTMPTEPEFDAIRARAWAAVAADADPGADPHPRDDDRQTALGRELVDPFRP